MANSAPPVGAWSSGLCDCFDDVEGCCLTFFCPCVTFGRIAGIVGQGATSCCASGALYFLLSAAAGLGCLYSCCYRSRLRAPLRARGQALRRLLRPPLLRALGALPGVPRAQVTRIRHVPRMGGERESRCCSNRPAPT
ncbi:hypothetical protein PVAP13_7NG172300 [Panicum virgatum]|uniref:Uncharacterized protein n=1 Tax=Panicum virgatum TaxID=38727 RepID=A0A8T0Q0L5_PANVG|nr:hypothetical protein PVAP13_7NG172300 [Panicum virgatum]